MTVTGPAPTPAAGDATPGGPDVVVVGAGVAGLVVARDLAARGRRVLVLERADRPGGCVASVQVAGLTVDAGAESFATRSSVVPDLLAELGLADDVVPPSPAGAWLQLPDRAVPLPKAGMLGIPGSPWAADVRAAVGVVGALRASLDRVLPGRVGLAAEGDRPAPEGDRPGTSLGRLVRLRQGRRVLDRLVTPVVAGVHATHPDDADLDVVLPGLRERMLGRGSLGAAVSAMRAAAPAGSAVAGLRGGMHRLVRALVADATRHGVELRTGVAVTALSRDDGGWRLAVEHVGAGQEDVAPGAGGPDGDGLPDILTPQVVLATPGPVTLRLLGDLLPAAVGPAAAAPADTGVELVTLLLDAPELDAAPRGTGVLVAPGTPDVTAKALTHATAKWAWLAQAAGPGRHVVRLSYGGARGTGGLDEDAPLATALADAAALLGVPLRAEQVVGWTRVPWPAGLPQVRPGHRDRARAVRRALEERPGLAACGAWLAGTGLVAVVGDARALAARF
ncbi:MAG: FAD-dependent oxidoreductase [Actinotalea sp.]|nr:FAD-dependent oxidoreductase [Actinotalea sp.]